LSNTQDFKEFLSGIDGESVESFCSLDFCNLYGSIALQDLNENTPSVFTVAKRFLQKYKKPRRNATYGRWMTMIFTHLFAFVYQVIMF
jgi:hypothetical protein